MDRKNNHSQVLVNENNDSMFKNINLCCELRGRIYKDLCNTLNSKTNRKLHKIHESLYDIYVSLFSLIEIK